jgi:hypothetical protein
MVPSFTNLHIFSVLDSFSLLITEVHLYEREWKRNCIQWLFVSFSELYHSACTISLFASYSLEGSVFCPDESFLCGSYPC